MNQVRLSLASSLSTLVLATLFGCSHAPPENFAPEPGLVEQIRELRVVTASHACPGQAFAATYTALLKDGSAVPFSTRYDRKHPPRLHVVFLDRYSEEADALSDGGWVAPRDPLVGAHSGYRLHAELKVRPGIATIATVAPDYSCQPHAFQFSGRSGIGSQPAGDGPDVTVSLAIVRSPFYERLLVAAIEVGEAPRFYVLADANAVPPRDWLIVKSAGGQGGVGRSGADGQRGTDGVAGCPGTPGAVGRRGEDGGNGGAGGRGGRITIIAPTEEPFLSGLVDADAPGGEGGRGGLGGKGGKGGSGGSKAPADSLTCVAGPDGADGPAGDDGRRGQTGAPGPRPRTQLLPTRDLFGPNIPPDLAELLGRR